jgi:DNA-binding response OmpR family regulator
METLVDSQVLNFGNLVIDLPAWEARLLGSPIILTKTEFRLRAALAARPRVVLTNEELTAILWGCNWYGDDNNLAVHVCKRRARLGESGIRPRFIRTVRGVRYRFEPNFDAANVPGTPVLPAQGVCVSIQN